MAQKVKELVYEKLRGLGADLDVNRRETLLIRDGAYCGHRYCVDSLQAVWFIEEDEIKFYGQDGRVIDHMHPSTAFAHRAA